jgi:hypothetical protein
MQYTELAGEEIISGGIFNPSKGYAFSDNFFMFGKTTNMLRTFFSILLILSVLHHATAQDANYWSSNYNAGGFFTPGAVIANNRDSGVFFYNPALLAYSTKTTTSITGTVYQWESTNIKNGAGTGKNLHSTNASIIPQMVSGSFALKGRKPFVLAYALLRNPVTSYEVTQRRDARFNVLDDSYSPGPEWYVGQYSSQNAVTETSGLLSAGFKLGHGWSTGFTAEGQIHKQTLDIDYSSRALLNTGNDTLYSPMASSQEHYLISYTHAGIRFKAGIAYETGRHHLGLLVSSPLLRLGGRGTLLSNNSITNLKLAGIDFNLLADTRQTHLKSRWKTPLSLALGYAFDYSNSGQIYVAAEYFAKVNDYNIITPRNEYFIRPDTGNNNQETSNLLKLKDARKAVLNFALGMSFRLKEGVMGYCSFRSDFNYAADNRYRDDNGYTDNTATWNLWHLQLGANFKKRKFNLRPGLLLSYGSTGKHLQPINFDNPSENNFLVGEPHLTRASHFSAGLMFSYIHNL